jgi:isocitrate dehydrogenase
MRIAVAKGDGIGPEVMDAVLHVFSAEGTPLDPVYVEMGKPVYLKGVSTGMTLEARETVESLGILFKGPMETPKGAGVKSINVTARKIWNAFANKRVFRSLDGVDTVFSKAGIPIDITMVRENIEDTYGAVEHMQTHDVAQCRRFITRPGSLQVHRYAFEMARRQGARRITCGHKANIMKMTDGLFLECFYEVAKDYPDIKADDLIVDDMAMKLVARPDLFDVVVLPNLQGDILSDLCAGLVGGLGYAPSANIGEHICIFEAVHGTAPDIAGQDKANPTALLLSALMMLRHIGLFRSAARIEAALHATLRTQHAAGAAFPGTQAFARLVAGNLPPAADFAHLDNDPAKVFRVPRRPDQPRMSASPSPEDTAVEGADFFIESTDSAEAVARRVRPLLPDNLRLTLISNRGTQVWPSASAFTECVNHYRVRVEKAPGADTPARSSLFELAAAVDKEARLCSMELLLRLGDRQGWSLAQGQ